MEIDRDKKKINKETKQIKRHRDTKAKRQRNYKTRRQRDKETLRH